MRVLQIKDVRPKTKTDEPDKLIESQTVTFLLWCQEHNREEYRAIIKRNQQETEPTALNRYGPAGCEIIQFSIHDFACEDCAVSYVTSLYRFTELSAPSGTLYILIKRRRYRFCMLICNPLKHFAMLVVWELCRAHAYRLPVENEHPRTEF